MDKGLDFEFQVISHENKNALLLLDPWGSPYCVFKSEDIPKDIPNCEEITYD